MIEVQNLTKRYGRSLAVDHISFSVDKGTVVGFLGPNGAGKSTTMNIITGYLSATSGSVTVGGCDTLQDPAGAKKQIGYLPEIPPLYMDMTVEEYLGFLYELKKVRLPRRKHIDEICGMVKIGDVKNRLIANLSKGYRQRVGIAQALLGSPPVLILDEPSVGLDPKQIIEIRGLIQELGERHTVILSSHILSEVQAVCQRVIVINRGRLVADGTPEQLARSLAGENRLTVRIEGNESKIKEMLCGLPGLTALEALGEKEPSVFEFILESGEEEDFRRAVFEGAVQNQFTLLGMKGMEFTLEDAFLRLTSNTDASEEDWPPEEETQEEEGE